jgi:hypothetical protein
MFRNMTLVDNPTNTNVDLCIGQWLTFFDSPGDLLR